MFKLSKDVFNAFGIKKAKKIVVLLPLSEVIRIRKSIFISLQWLSAKWYEIFGHTCCGLLGSFSGTKANLYLQYGEIKVMGTLTH